MLAVQITHRQAYCRQPLIERGMRIEMIGLALACGFHVATAGFQI